MQRAFVSASSSEVVLRCPESLTCPAQLRGAETSFVLARQWIADGLGEKVIDQLMEKAWWVNPLTCTD